MFAFLKSLIQSVPEILPTIRPDREKWKPVGNSGGADDVMAYELAAKKCGIEIKVGYPIPSENSELCFGLGLKGIYILRSQADRQSELQNEKWNQAKLLAS